MTLPTSPSPALVILALPEPVLVLLAVCVLLVVVAACLVWMAEQTDSTLSQVAEALATMITVVANALVALLRGGRR